MRRGPKALARVSESAGGFRQMYLGAPLAMPPMMVRSRLRCMPCVYATHASPQAYDKPTLGARHTRVRGLLAGASTVRGLSLRGWGSGDQAYASYTCGQGSDGPWVKDWAMHMTPLLW